MSRRCWMVLAGLVALAMAGTSVAAEGWSLSKLVPFQKSSADKRARASVSDDDRGGGFPTLSMPSWGSRWPPLGSLRQPCNPTGRVWAPAGLRGQGAQAPRGVP